MLSVSKPATGAAEAGADAAPDADDAAAGAVAPDAALGCPAFWLQAVKASEAAMMLKTRACFFICVAFFAWIERARL